MPTQFSAPPSNIPPAFTQALGLHNGSLVAIIGSGGKTTLMHSLARANAVQRAVLCTTTTKLWEPLPEECPFCLLPTLPCAQGITAGPLARHFPHGTGMCTIGSAYAEQPATQNKQGAHSPHPHAMLADGTPRKKIIGYPPELLDAWWPTVQASAFTESILLVEADGSAGRPVKAHSPKEPLIPAATQVVIGVVGLWGLGQPLHEDTVWRPEIFAQRSGLPLGAPITPRAVAQVITHAQGLFSRAPATARTLLFLNGAETPATLALAHEVAHEVSKAAAATRNASGSASGTQALTLFAGSARTLQGECLCVHPE
ncbi:selenium cofactor biosynthesis protein YqeC [Desulfovibrio cuneatus]|uniref:selenium cofactor biosynthesis protein YqeC n=1 Tax=Desulfovibrio cuneatus TaxID=159728 RepID=UPI000420E03C|nr:selenium cofactor biosynthesis protein YqeC [Desulfovibrio cuneatus]